MLVEKFEFCFSVRNFVCAWAFISDKRFFHYQLVAFLTHLHAVLPFSIGNPQRRLVFLNCYISNERPYRLNFETFWASQLHKADKVPLPELELPREIVEANSLELTNPVT